MTDAPGVVSTSSVNAPGPWSWMARSAGRLRVEAGCRWRRSSCPSSGDLGHTGAVVARARTTFIAAASSCSRVRPKPTPACDRSAEHRPSFGCRAPWRCAAYPPRRSGAAATCCEGQWVRAAAASDARPITAAPMNAPKITAGIDVPSAAIRTSSPAIRSITKSTAKTKGMPTAAPLTTASTCRRRRSRCPRAAPVAWVR